MRALSVFDQTEFPLGWFDETALPGGWFDDFLLNLPQGANIFYVIGPATGWTDPTATEIITGRLSGGAFPTDSNFQAAPSVTTDPFDFDESSDGLAAIAYKIAFVWWNGTLPYTPPNVSNVAVGDLPSSSYAALCLIAGQLTQKAAATGSDIKVYLTSAGLLVAKTAAGGGDRLVTLSGGVLTAT